MFSFNPDDVERPGSQRPYILDTTAMAFGFILFILGFVFLLFFQGNSSNWWILLYFRDLLIFGLLLYWIHSSEEISGFSMRRLYQNFTTNSD